MSESKLQHAGHGLLVGLAAGLVASRYGDMKNSNALLVAGVAGVGTYLWMVQGKNLPTVSPAPVQNPPVVSHPATHEEETYLTSEEEEILDRWAPM